MAGIALNPLPMSLFRAGLAIGTATGVWLGCTADNAAAAATGEPLRLASLQRCGDLLDPERFEFCIELKGHGTGPIRLVLDGNEVGTAAAADDDIRFTLARQDHDSGPFRVEQGDRASNAAWLSMQDSATVAATHDEVAENDDGIDTYVDLVSIVIEEAFDAGPEARRLAEKYGARIVGAIPPLRIYQLRLPVDDLVHRDALVLRLNGEESVDIVVIEESSRRGSGLLEYR